MQICYICSEYPPSVHGGLGVVTQVLARRLAARGHQIRVLGVCPSDDDAPEHEVQDGVEIWRLHTKGSRLRWLSSRVRLFQMVRAWALKGEIDLVEVPQSRGWCAGWGRLPIPVVVRFHGSACLGETKRGLSGSSRFVLEWLALRRADRCCAVSHSIAALTGRRFRMRATDVPVIYNPVDVTVVAATTVPTAVRRSARVVSAGTCSSYKGIPVLLTAWPVIRREFHHAELHLFGREGEPGMFAAARRCAGTDGGVFVHGYVDRARVIAELRSAAVAVFPSLGEAFGLAAAEAMACGCATVFSAAGSGVELIRDGEDGVLVDPGSAEQVAQAVGRILRDPELARRLGEAGRVAVRERFGVDRIVPANEQFYTDVVESFRTELGKKIG